MTQPIRDPGRVAVLEKIAEYEKARRFDEDVEEDPPTIPLEPDKIDYLHKGIAGGCRRVAAFASAYVYFWNLERTGQMRLEPTEGLEHLAEVPGGAVLTCNHFHPMDSFIMQRVFDHSHHRKRMYRVIREGNYTSFPGYYGFLMRNCNTLPLSDNMQTMKKFLKAVEQVLAAGNCVLVFPEQSLWWQYRKPKPMKPGAFDLAARSHVPVVPCFITMRDSDSIGPDGFPVQVYTPHLGTPIYPDESLPRPRAREKLRRQAEQFALQTYCQVYGQMPQYTCGTVFPDVDTP